MAVKSLRERYLSRPSLKALSITGKFVVCRNYATAWRCVHGVNVAISVRTFVTRGLPQRQMRTGVLN